MSAEHSVWNGLWSVADPVSNIRALRRAVVMVWTNRELCLELVKREMGSQFAGEALGAFWIIGHPIMLFGVYIFMFVIVLKTRIPISYEMPRDYTTYILSGLVPWLFVQQALARGANALVGQVNLVKQVVFPVEVLPFVAVIVSSVTLAVGMAILILYSVVIGGGLPWTYVLLPFVIAAHLLLMTGLALMLAGVTPFFRDIKDIIQVLSIVGVYVIPAFYFPSWVPEPIRPLLYLNPFSYVVWVYQDVLFFGALEHPMAWILFGLGSLGAVALGYRSFQAVRLLVANVI